MNYLQSSTRKIQPPCY